MIELFVCLLACLGGDAWGRGLNFNDPGGSPSFLFDNCNALRTLLTLAPLVQSSECLVCIPQYFSVVSLAFVRVLLRFDDVLLSFPALIFFPVRLPLGMKVLGT